MVRHSPRMLGRAYQLRSWRSKLSATVLLALVVASGIWLIHLSHAAVDYADSFVGVSGTQFTVAGQPFRFVGANMYDLAGSYDNGKFGCGPVYTDAELNASLATLHDQAGAGVVRFWAFQSYTKGGTDWSQLDRVVAAARAHNIKLLPVLENQYGDCTTANYNKDSNWYTSGYKSPYGGYALSYPDYVRAIVTRYKNDPTIMSWMLMNEASADNTAMASFARDMSAYIKSLDSNHLVTLGTLADQGQPGEASANDIYNLYSASTLDYVDAHDYNFDSQALPRSSYDQGGVVPDANTCLNSIACDLSVSLNRLHKPFLVGEAGIVAGTDSGSQNQRVSEFNAKISAMFGNGGAGYLVWSYAPSNPTSDDFSPGDPLISLLHSYASPINTGAAATPSVTPAPPTSTPTATPVPTATPTPTAMPTPTPTATPLPTPAGATMLDDTASNFSYNGAWSTSTGSAKYAGDDHYTASSGSSASFTFIGSRAQIYGTMDNYYGKASFSIDGGAATTVDLYHSSRLEQVVLFDTGVLSAQTHTITITDTGTKNAASNGITLSLDAAAYVPGGTATTPTPTPTPVATRKNGDVNGDGVINVVDLSLLLAEWGKSNANADFNHDGTINVVDLSMLLAQWGK